MKKIWSLLKNHVQEDFSVKYYASVFVFLALALSINYYLGLENDIIDRYPTKPIRILWYLLLYSVAYYGACLLMIYFKKRNNLLTSLEFWLLTSAGILLLSIDSGFPYMSDIIARLDVDIRIYRWAFSIGNNLIGFIVTTLPLVCLYFIYKSSTRYFGLHLKGFDVKPYFALLLIVFPFILLASFESSFQNYYPTYKTNLVAETFHWPTWMPAIMYEFIYGLDFFNTEFLFRGFMVIGLAHILGKDAIIPMVATYCFLHFGKPVGEAISSIWGGYLLGVIAFYSRSIWGGVILHIGLAWMMELAAYLQKLL